MKNEFDRTLGKMYEGRSNLGSVHLGDALMICGDDENAIAVWSLIQSTQVLQRYYKMASEALKSKDHPKASDGNHGTKPRIKDLAAWKRKLTGPIDLDCHGGCGRN